MDALWCAILPHLSTILPHLATALATLTVGYLFLPSKWVEKRIDLKFTKELEWEKAAFNQQLEEKRFSLSQKAIRQAKVYEKETLALETILGHLAASYEALQILMTPFSIGTDLNYIEKESLSQVLAGYDLEEEQKESIISSSNPNDQLYKIQQANKLNSLGEAMSGLEKAYQQNSVFLDKQLEEPFNEILLLQRKIFKGQD